MSTMRSDPSHRPGGSSHLPSREGGSTAPGGIGLSIIVPARNEAESLPRLIEEIALAFRPIVARGESAGHRMEGFEVVLVDDASTDDTPEVLDRLAPGYPELKPVRMARNVGQSSAIVAGFREARGAFVATLDADLQNDPGDLARLWDLLPGFDAVLGWRQTRRDVWTKRQVSRWANRVRNLVLGQSIRDTGCSVRIFPRDVALRLPMFHGAHRFFGPLLLREGCAIRQEPVGHRPRPHGSSHYSLRNRSWAVVVDLIGVAWLMRRPVRYEAADVPPAAPGPGASARPVASRQEA
ncbi:glycosyltransferase family 2 protein [Tautonia plasticadhaerens]|uniref:Undecaprenyl-phosphate 4-deoxy-4-formamido-L-arabinose transferase n=1 Tax=Tautonia plasticadhaerens TaxID=2527974 RepID=A0A518GUX2_9BACT|nr:glycosyltransferase family 2 protein [Tautonia plasticadhaerens]QDV32388.1 Undecaprenyl-phosphate 4-deoxy-4-formamido-L-arabinose transferase [Tautonia plasticadhaerens]